jgi:hypothetical protein
MLENNTHVTGDNKGVSSYLFEQASLTDPTAAPGFVAGFSQANVGDTTPNILGAWCDNGSGEMCTFENSTCDGVSETCHGRGLSHSNLPQRSTIRSSYLSRPRIPEARSRRFQLLRNWQEGICRSPSTLRKIPFCRFTQVLDIAYTPLEFF